MWSRDSQSQPRACTIAGNSLKSEVRRNRVDNKDQHQQTCCLGNHVRAKLLADGQKIRHIVRASQHPNLHDDAADGLVADRDVKEDPWILAP